MREVCGYLPHKCSRIQIPMMVRNFEYEDLIHVVRIADNALTEEYTMDFFLYLWQISSDGFMVAEENGKIVGFLIAIQTSVDELRILMLAVDEKFRRRGIGSMLLRNLLSKYAGIRRVYLEVRYDNDAAIKFYRKHGFRIKERIDDFYTDGSPAYLMEKILF